MFCYKQRGDSLIGDVLISSTVVIDIIIIIIIKESRNYKNGHISYCTHTSGSTNATGHKVFHGQNKNKYNNNRLLLLLW